MLIGFSGAKFAKSFVEREIWDVLLRYLKERSDMGGKQISGKQKTLVTKDELNKALLEARESGEMVARIEVGKWIEANMLTGPYYTVYSGIFPSIIKRLKQGKRL